MKLHHFRLSRLFIRLAAFFRKNFVAISLFLFLALLVFVGVRGFSLLSRLHVKPQDLLGFFGTPSADLESTGGSTNFLLLGIRGEGSDSPNLSDTIIVLNYNHETQTPTLIGIPRDLWVPSLQAKINTAYYYGEEASPGSGIKMAQAAVMEDLGLPIHYTAVVNFAIFKDTIDLLGGIDIDINHGFVDSEYPIAGMEDALPISSRYETVVFATGSAHLNGDTALKFVRSRHSLDEEGTDFARSRRQQQVIAALKQKILTPTFLLDKGKLDSFFSILDRNLITNLDQSLYPTVAKLALDAQNKAFRSITLSNTPDENGVTILYHPPQNQYRGEWVLVPKDNNWSALKKYLTNRLENSQ